MARTTNSLLDIAGFTIQGDFGPITTYTNKRKKVYFPKIWLSDPTSPAQQAHRDRIRTAARLWQNLCPCQRGRWELATQRCHCHLNGYNLWTFWWLTQDDDKIATIERNSRLTLLPPMWKTDYRCPTCTVEG
jgi:hypothetical protein